MLQQTGYLPHLSVSRFNRRLHALQEVLLSIVSILGEMLASGHVFVIDTLPVWPGGAIKKSNCRYILARR